MSIHGKKVKGECKQSTCLGGCHWTRENLFDNAKIKSEIYKIPTNKQKITAKGVDQLLKLVRILMILTKN